MTRRTLLGGIVPALLVPVRSAWAQEQTAAPGWTASAVGQPVNLARYGEAKSWLNPGKAEALGSKAWLDENSQTALEVGDLASGTGETDVGVEWPEFRTVEKIVIQYAPGKSPQHGQQFIEHWSGLTALQGGWKRLGRFNQRCLSSDRRRYLDIQLRAHANLQSPPPAAGSAQYRYPAILRFWAIPLEDR